jgi:hypothetical protein
MSITLYEEARIREVHITKEGTAVYDPNPLRALREAQKHAGKKGDIATMPQLLRSRANASFHNEIWTDWYNTNSWEYIGKTPQGNSVVIVAHGIGPFTTLKRIEQAYNEAIDIGKITLKELTGLLGSDTPSFSYDEFTKRNHLPSKYAIIMDFETVQKTVSDHQHIDNLRTNPLFIARAGGKAQAKAFLDKAATKYQKYGQLHPFKNMDVEQPEGRMLRLDKLDHIGLNGLHFFAGGGHFVAIAPETQERINGAATPIVPTLEQIAEVLNPYVAPACHEEVFDKLQKLYYSFTSVAHPSKQQR